MPSSSPSTYFQQLHNYLIWQTGQIQALEQKVEALSRAVDALSKQKGITIERIEYNFDQLKVDRLEGTLNVGLSPGGLNEKTLEDLSVEGKTIQSNTEKSASFGRILDRVLAYLQEDCPLELAELQAEAPSALDEQFCKRMIDDLRNQARSRILYYMNTMVDPSQPTLTAAQEQDITNRVIEDIREAIRQYAKNSGVGGGNGHEAGGRE